MSYAKGTSVSTDRSQAEIKNILKKYNATGFAFGEQAHASVVMFEMSGRRIKFVLPMPDPEDKKFTQLNSRNSWKVAAKTVQIARYEQAQRERWRALTLAIKAKLECVETGIETIEQAFLAHLVLPNGATVGQAILPQIEQASKDQKMPPLLGYN